MTRRYDHVFRKNMHCAENILDGACLQFPLNVKTTSDASIHYKKHYWIFTYSFLFALNSQYDPNNWTS